MELVCILLLALLIVTYCIRGDCVAKYQREVTENQNLRATISHYETTVMSLKVEIEQQKQRIAYLQLIVDNTLDGT